jgi:transposase
MGKTLSVDLRSRVIAAVEGGLSCHAAAAQFQIGIATAVRWVSVFRQTGAVSPKPKGGDTRSHRIEAYQTVILDAIQAQKDITLVELSELLRLDHGAAFAPSTLGRFLKRHAITFKKNRTRQRAGTPRRGSPAPGMVCRSA